MFIKNADEDWIKYDNAKIKDSNISMSLYDLNKSIISQLEPLSDDELELNMKLINDWANKLPDTFFMLLSHDENYFTIFRSRSKKNLEFDNLGQAVITCLKDFYTINSISLNEDSIEIWGKNEEKDNYACFYLFPYDRGIVDYRR